MSDLLLPYIDKIIEILENFGIIAGFLIVVLESIVPILPLGVFVAFNFSAYGVLEGFLISYVATCFGCMLAYYLSSVMLSVYVRKKEKENKKISTFTKRFRKIKFSNLVLIIALPFSPAFLINITAGIIKMDLKKFIPALLVGKLSIIYFWGVVGKSFIDSLGDIKSLIIIFLSLGLSYVLSKLLSKKLNIE